MKKLYAPILFLVESAYAVIVKTHVYIYKSRNKSLKQCLKTKSEDTNEVYRSIIN